MSGRCHGWSGPLVPRATRGNRTQKRLKLEEIEKTIGYTTRGKLGWWQYFSSTGWGVGGVYAAPLGLHFVWEFKGNGQKGRAQNATYRRFCSLQGLACERCNVFCMSKRISIALSLCSPGACSLAVRNLSPAALQPATLQLAACNLAACSLATCSLAALQPGALQTCSPQLATLHALALPCPT